jgi:restriction system protein
MAIPDFQTIMLPLLQFYGDQQEHSIHAATEHLAQQFNLSDQELNNLLPSGKQTTFYNRVGWARTYLAKSGMLEMTRRSFYVITDRGLDVLESKPDRIDMRYLTKYPEFVNFRKSRKKTTSHTPNEKEIVELTPEETLEEAYQEIRDNLAQELLSNIMKCSPAFFENLVVELLVKMGYGGSRSEAARAVGQTSDGGIDGIIDEDRLGLDTIYIQAKRWEGNVGRPEIQKFVGALMGKRARKGIFITSSSFSPDALSYVHTIDYKVILIDGKKLADFMIDYDVGVSEITAYKIKRIDSDYFSPG